MNEYPLFHENILRCADLSKDELAHLSSFYTLEKITKNETILKKGEVCEFEGYVYDGCFKVFYEDENSREHILYFAVEDWWILDIGSFISGGPSELSIQALEDSTILKIDRHNKDKLYSEMPKVEKIFRIMNQKSLAAMQSRMISMLHKNAENRYLDFIERYPTLTQRIPQHQISSYLGISHEFLSKVRKKVLQEK